MITSKWMYGGLGAAVVDRCYNYVLLNSSYLCRSYTQTYKFKIWPSQRCCYKMFTALLVPVTPSSMKSNIPISLLEFLSCQDNKKPAGKPIRKYGHNTIKRKKYKHLMLKKCARPVHILRKTIRGFKCKKTLHIQNFEHSNFYLIATD